MNIIEKIFLSIESHTAFSDRWYGIIFNPFYITRKQLFRAVEKFAKTITEDDRILDVGCGTKPYKKLFKSTEYVGIDISSEKSVDKLFDGVKIPYKTEKFDVVIATEVLEHALFPEKLISEMKRVLRPGGKLFITMPFVWPEHAVPIDFQRFTSFQHRRLLNKYKMKIISISQTTGTFGTCGQILSDFYYSELVKRIFGLSLSYGAKFILFRIVSFLVCFPTQFIFESLDILFRRKGITLDYVIVAQKNSSEI